MLLAVGSQVLRLARVAVGDVLLDVDEGRCAPSPSCNPSNHPSTRAHVTRVTFERARAGGVF